MRYLIPLLLISGLTLTACAPTPPEMMEVKQTNLDKPDMEAILLCVAKPTDGDERMADVEPKFSLRNDRRYPNNVNWVFKNVGTHWCTWDDQFNGGTTFAFTLEPENGQASATKELLVWHARQGEEIKKVVARTAHATIQPVNGVLRGVIILRDPGATVIVIDADLSVELPDV